MQNYWEILILAQKFKYLKTFRKVQINLILARNYKLGKIGGKIISARNSKLGKIDGENYYVKISENLILARKFKYYLKTSRNVQINETI